MGLYYAMFLLYTMTPKFSLEYPQTLDCRCRMKRSADNQRLDSLAQNTDSSYLTPRRRRVTTLQDPIANETKVAKSSPPIVPADAKQQ